MNPGQRHSTRADLSVLSDDELVERVQAGQQEAFAELYHRHERAVYTNARDLLGNDADAWDAIQDAIIKAHAGLRRFRGESSFYTWLMTLVRNAAKDILRRRAPRRTAEEGLRQLEQDRDARRRRRRPRTLLDELVAKELWQEIARILRRAAQRHATRERIIERLVWILRVEEEMTYPEIAGVFEGMTEDIARNVVRRLRIILQEHLS